MTADWFDVEQGLSHVAPLMSNMLRVAVRGRSTSFVQYMVRLKQAEDKGAPGEASASDQGRAKELPNAVTEWCGADVVQAKLEVTRLP